MESISNNSELDSHISGILKNDSVHLQPIDWSEVGALLHHEKKSVLPAIKINKKIILISSGVAISVIIVLGLVKIALYYSNVNSNVNHKKSEPGPTPASNSFQIIDNAKSPVIDSVSTNKNDLNNEKQKIDSIISNALTTTTAVTNTQKQEKKKKLNAISPDPISDDTTLKNIGVTEPPAINTDSTSIPAIEENNSTSPPPVDTINKNNSSSKKNSKRRNKKSQKTTDSLGETKPDSLKQ